MMKHIFRRQRLWTRRVEASPMSPSRLLSPILPIHIFWSRAKMRRRVANRLETVNWNFFIFFLRAREGIHHRPPKYAPTFTTYIPPFGATDCFRAFILEPRRSTRNLSNNPARSQSSRNARRPTAQHSLRRELLRQPADVPPAFTIHRRLLIGGC